MIELPKKKLKCEKRTGHAPRDSDGATAQHLASVDIFIGCWVLGVRRWMFPHNDRPVSIAHARATGQQRVFVRDIRIRVNRDRGNMQLAAPRPLIQRLNVVQPMFEPVTAEIDLIFRDRVEHERVVGVGGMTECEKIRRVLCTAMHYAEEIGGRSVAALFD